MLLQELCLPYELSAADLEESEPLAMLLLVTYLFTALPQLLPRATLEFTCKLGEQQVRHRCWKYEVLEEPRCKLLAWARWAPLQPVLFLMLQAQQLPQDGRRDHSFGQPGLQ